MQYSIHTQSAYQVLKRLEGVGGAEYRDTHQICVITWSVGRRSSRIQFHCVKTHHQQIRTERNSSYIVKLSTYRNPTDSSGRRTPFSLPIICLRLRHPTSHIGLPLDSHILSHIFQRCHYPHTCAEVYPESPL